MAEIPTQLMWYLYIHYFGYCGSWICCIFILSLQFRSYSCLSLFLKSDIQMLLDGGMFSEF